MVRECVRQGRGSSVLWLVAGFLGFGGGRVPAAPAAQVDLASKTAWTFQPDGENTQAKTLPVPAGGWRLNGFPEATAGTYERRIQIPKLPGGGPQVTEIAFEAVNWEATVSVGPDAAHLQEAAHHLSAWTPFRVDISRYVTPGGSALLRVYVRDRTFFKDAEGHYTVPAATEWNDREARGILRGVWLRVYPVVYIEDVFVRPSTVQNTLAYDVTIVNASDKVRRVAVEGRLSAWNPGVKWNYPNLPALKVDVGAHTGKRFTLSPVAWTPGRASWWWPNVPYRPDYHAQLYNLSLTLEDGWPNPATGNKPPALQTEIVRFGFCTPGQQGNTYTLNGVRINLRGDSLPEGTIGTDAFARLPGFLPPTATNPGWPGAVRNYQRLNVNVVRMHQVPCTHYMMDVCDELGLLVIPETAIRGAGARANLTALPDSYTAHLRELILRDRNHPSVFKWSLENELFGAPEAFLRTLYDTCQSADGTRPCSIDDNADYPSWPGFAVMEHYTQSPGTPDAAGGHPRTDRPFGQGEYVWPAGNTPRGPLWFALMTRSLRAHDNADYRPYTLLDVWPGVIPGLTPTNFPDPPLPPVSLEQGGRSVLDPARPWEDPFLQLLQRSFAPVAAYDREFDIANTPSNGHGEWPGLLPTLPSGQTVTRQLVLFNDEFTGSQLKLDVAPVLRPKSDTRLPLPIITRKVSLAPGAHTTLALDLPVPAVKVNTTLEITLRVSKGGQELFRETLPFVIVPEGAAGTQAQFEGRDDTTQGNWVGHYGAQAFLVPIRQGYAAHALPSIFMQRGTGFETRANSPFDERLEQQNALLNLETAESVDDPRVALHGPGLTDRSPTAFTTEGGQPLMMRVNTSDGQPHLLSLYLLDYPRKGQAMDVDIFDLQGHRLDTRRVDSYGNGAYLRYRFTGSIIVRMTPLTSDAPTLSGFFIDPAPGAGLLWQK